MLSHAYAIVVVVFMMTKCLYLSKKTQLSFSSNPLTGSNSNVPKRSTPQARSVHPTGVARQRWALQDHQLDNFMHRGDKR